MIMNRLIFLSAILIVAGCTTQQASNTLPCSYRVPTEHKKTTPHYQFSEGDDPALEKAFNHYLQTGKAPNIMTDGFIKFAFNADQQPIIKTTPFQATVISLEPGEHFTTITTGDPSRWSYTVATSGSGIQQQQNVLVKPAMPQISTNMVITTDKRMYNLRIISLNNEKPTRSVSFWYPEEMASFAKNTSNTGGETMTNTLSEINLRHLNFNYTISSPFFSQTPPWKPMRAFDDGTHTYIEFSEKLSQRDMPVLFVQEGKEQQLVNYHVKPPYFVVDKIFEKAVLVMGEKQSIKITITNKCY